MDTAQIKSRQETLVNLASTQRNKPPEANELNTESRSENELNNNALKVTDETIKLSDTSLKLSSSSPVKSSDKTSTIENQDQAQRVLSQILADFQTNPVRAQQAHSSVSAGSVKLLLGG